MTVLRRWLQPARRPMTVKQAAVRFTLVAAVLYLAVNALLLSGYGQVDWTTGPVDGCGSGMFCGTHTPVDQGGER